MMPFIESNNKDKLHICYDVYREDQDDIVVLIHPIEGNICYLI